MSEIGVITEQGDLGLGFNVISEKEEKIVKENVIKDNKDSKVINE